MKTETSHIKTAIMLVSETRMASTPLLLKEFHGDFHSPL